MEKHVRTRWGELKILLEGLECYKDIQMKDYDITKLTAELKSDNVQCINEIQCVHKKQSQQLFSIALSNRN